MSRATMPTLHCDAEVSCDAWEVDYFAVTAYSVGVTRITETMRAPGWTSTVAGDDYCPDHVPDRPDRAEGRAT